MQKKTKKKGIFFKMIFLNLPGVVAFNNYILVSYNSYLACNG